ncbi:MAG: hypothetical protein J3K34DRAFT_505946 [Monoraphidium minutum]|nr:MAG: hypothetical protein J3K34DRAFT_505946 [Monoraphidium minutum]
MQGALALGEGADGLQTAMSAEEAWDAMIVDGCDARAPGAAPPLACAPPGAAAAEGDTGHWQGDGTTLGDASDAEGAREEDSWRDLYRVFMGSLRASSAHFNALTLETLALGWAGLSAAHGGAWDAVPGAAWGLERREQMQELLAAARWAGAFEAGCKTKAELAAYLELKEEDVAAFEAAGRPLCPAHYVAVDWAAPRVCVVVRGTSTWADTMTDLVAHTEPYQGGHVHSGMLAAARAILQQQFGAIEALLRDRPGYELHCIGHSLGGGVGALVAHILRTEPAYVQRLSAALCRGVRGVGLGTPPIFSRELAEGCGPFFTTLVHNHDLVPRTCVAGFLRDSGALSAGKQAARTLWNAAMAGGAVRVATRSPVAQALVQVAANKLKAMHSEALARKAEENGGGGGGGAQEQQRLLGEEAAARAQAADCDGGRFQMEEREARLMLYAPGTLLFLKRWQDAPDAPPRHSLVEAPPGGARFGRIIINRSMLRDHYLTSIVHGLQQFLGELKAEAAAASEAAAAPDAAAALEVAPGAGAPAPLGGELGRRMAPGARAQPSIGAGGPAAVPVAAAAAQAVAEEASSSGVACAFGRFRSRVAAAATAAVAAYAEAAAAGAATPAPPAARQGAAGGPLAGAQEGGPGETRPAPA